MCWAGVWNCDLWQTWMYHHNWCWIGKLMKDFSNLSEACKASNFAIWHQVFFMKFPRNTLNKIFGAMKTCLVGVRLAVPWGHEWRSRCWLLYCVYRLWVSPLAGNSIGKCEGIWIKLSLISHWESDKKVRKVYVNFCIFCPTEWVIFPTIWTNLSGFR